MITLQRKVRLRLWLLRFKLAAAWRNLAQDFWFALAPYLWQFPAMREAYYAYRERSWNNAQAALSFELWLAAGGWKRPPVGKGE